uniref:Spermatogenesis-associated protein 25 n=1 Tax=Pelusios castaneus TaxID=367368 RepID=A0A8C8S217_9SAUR
MTEALSAINTLCSYIFSLSSHPTETNSQLPLVKSNLVSDYQCGETSPLAGVLVPGLLRRKAQESAAPPHVIASLRYQEQKTLKQPCSGAQQSSRLPLSSRSGDRDTRWEPYNGPYCGRYSRKFPKHKQYESSVWDSPAEQVRDKWSGGPSRGAFPLATCGFPPRCAFLMPVKIRKNRGGHSVQTPPSNTCILTLAMIIAGIPTVPAPGIKEEDLIRAAQNFMTENPEQDVQGEITAKRRGDNA